jgi:heptaprenyl diphosphate synthase
MSHTSSFEVPRSSEDLSAAVSRAMEVFEERLAEAVSAAHPLLDQSARHLVAAGGKRFRPLMVLVSSHLGDPDHPDVLEAALVVELTHLATLYHDDVMDEAEVRRGGPSANERYGNSVAILTGDYLFARASDVAARLGPECVRIQAETFSRLVQGQIAETLGPADTDDPIDFYLRVLADKTGSLIATSALFGAKLSGASPQQQQILARFGERIGVAFQLADDVIDIASDGDESGKTPGTDLREGVPTLPGLFAQASTDPADARLVDLVSRPLSDDAEVTEALTLLRGHPSMHQAKQTVQDWAARARAELDDLPDGPVKDALVEITHSVAERTA